MKERSEIHLQEQWDKKMGIILRGGLILACLIVTIGGVIFLKHHSTEHPHYEIFQGVPMDLNNFSGIWNYFLQWRGRAIIQMGVVLLLLTPSILVFASGLYFFRKKDWIYVIITGIVLFVLVHSFFIY